MIRPKSLKKSSRFEVNLLEEQLREVLYFSEKPSREMALAAVSILLGYIGEDPNREGLLKTPERVVRALESEWCIGYNRKYIQQQTLSILGAQFADGAENYDTMIVVKDISFHSMCEHHMALFSGIVSIGYIPSQGGRILGLSKLARIVNMFSRRLQVQERLTTQIADFINIHCKPLGVGVIVRAKHSCMGSRGVHQPNSEAVTSALRGQMLDQQDVRQEFLSLVR